MTIRKATKPWRALKSIVNEAQRIQQAKATGILKMGSGRRPQAEKRGTK